MTLETFTGNLKEAYGQLVPGTMLHVDELTNERRLNPITETGEDLREQWFYTADGEIYFLDGWNKTPALAITRETHNPILQHIDDASEQLVNNHNYLVSQSAVEQALAAPDTEIIALPNLRLSDGAEWRYLKISTSSSKYANLNDTERRFAERVFGRGDDFTANMEMLKKAKISETRIYVLNPDYVRKHASESAVARASWLSNFNYDSCFNAIVRYIYSHYRVRGVRKKSSNDLISAQECDSSSHSLRRRGGEGAPEAHVAKNQGPYRTPAQNEFKVYYDVLLADPEGAMKAMDDKTAAGLAGIIQTYLATRGQ